MYRNTFPAKTLLFGEHRVLCGAPALAVPYPAFALQWCLYRGRPDPRLQALATYLGHHVEARYLRLILLKKALAKGWQLVGNVPEGYGLGSSGAVCAAIWHRFATREGRELPTTELRRQLSRMEAHYHGSSSGTDPLISLLQRPVLLGEHQLAFPDLHPDWNKPFFLLDTGHPRQSGKLVSNFLHRYRTDPDWQLAVDERWGTADRECIDAVLQHQPARLYPAFYALSMYQAALMRDFIPPDIRKVWRGQSYRLKLCGAGGGGFMLGYSTDLAKTRQELGAWPLYPLLGGFL